MGEQTRYINLMEAVDQKMASPKTKKESRQIQKVHDLVHYIKQESPYIQKKITAPILSSPKRNDARKTNMTGSALDQQQPSAYEALYPIGRNHAPTDTQKTHRLDADQIIDHSS